MTDFKLTSNFHASRLNPMHNKKYAQPTAHLTVVVALGTPCIGNSAAFQIKRSIFLSSCNDSADDIAAIPQAC